jgi:hypothetical protein
MQAFKVNRDSWHYKLNQKFMNERGDNEWYMRDNWEQRHNNFCSYWRVTMFRLVFALFIAAFSLLVLFAAGTGIYQDPWSALMIVSTAIGIFVIFIGLLAVAAYFDARKRKRGLGEVPDSLFVAKYKAYKSKVCPMVEYEK